jgi:hypothetical protein
MRKRSDHVVVLANRWLDWLNQGRPPSAAVTDELSTSIRPDPHRRQRTPGGGRINQ